jgi:two-component system CheB/CheR fusion protein
VIRTADVSQLVRLRNELDEATSQRQQLSNEFHRLELANEDLAVTNASLRAANEELQISNEEFQAAAEEVETLNEELQATNEELETLNEELQATIEELNAANEDLDARSRALEEAVLLSEQQRQQSDDARARLEAVLAGMSSADAVVVIDEEGEFVLANPAFIDTFGKSGEFLQVQAEDGTPLALDQTPQQRAARGESFTMRLYMTGQDGKRRALEATGHSIGANQRQGGVIVVRTLNDR